MMQATLSPILFDPLGSVTIDVMPDQTAGETRRRMNRVATLDGGAAFNDFGYSEADRTIVLRWKPKNRKQHDAIDRIMKLYSRVHLSMHDGFYLVALEVYAPGATESTLTALVVEKLA